MGCSAGPQVERWCRTPGVFSSLIAVDQVGPVGAEAFDEAEGQQGVVHRGAGVLVQRPYLLVEPTGVRLRVVRQLAATQNAPICPETAGKNWPRPKVSSLVGKAEPPASASGPRSGPSQLQDLVSFLLGPWHPRCHPWVLAASSPLTAPTSRPPIFSIASAHPCLAPWVPFTWGVPRG